MTTEQTPRAMIKELMSGGYTQPQIARRCNSSQATISRLLTGEFQDCRHSIVVRLKRMVDDLAESKKQAA